MSSSPQGPYEQRPASDPRSRGLVVAISLLLVAVLALAVVLVLVLTGEDRDEGGPAAETTGSTLEAGPGQGSPAPGGGRQAPEDRPQGNQANPDPPRDGTGRTSPSESLDEAESQELLLEQAQRDPNDPYALGDADAEIVIVQFADYLCWYCAVWHVEVADALEPLLASGQVRFEYRDYPVRGEASVYSALAARAAGEQGLFWEYGDALYQDVYDETGPAYDRAYFESVAARVGVEDIERFSSDMSDSDALADIMASRDVAMSLGISGTPTFIVHDTLVPGALDEEQFLMLVESRLA